MLTPPTEQEVVVTKDYDLSELEFDEATGAITFRSRVVGEFSATDKVLEFNAGWLRLAGIGIRVMGDSDDRRRVLLERGVGKKVGPELDLSEPEPREEKTETPKANVAEAFPATEPK